MNKSLLLRDIKKLNDNMNDAINYVDIDYDIKKPYSNDGYTHTRSMICRNDYAILNAYRLWLQSRRYDYIRAPNFGGLFDMALNDRVTFGPENEDAVKAIIVEETSAKWPDITIIECHVTAVMSKREWLIKILAQDKGTKMVLMDDNVSVSADPAEFL